MTTQLYIGNAPCSWGTLEFEGLASEPLTYTQMLDELVETGYTGTELGDWGFMPTVANQLSLEMSTRNLMLSNAFVPVKLEDPTCHAAGEATAVRTAQLIAAVAQQTGATVQPILVLAGENGVVQSIRTLNAGRITDEMGLNDEQWQIFAAGANRIARAVREQSGLRTVFHHHCAGWVETPSEIARLMELTDPDLLGLVFDTGHYAFAAGGVDSMLDALDYFDERVWYVHFKDCHPGIAIQSREKACDYFTALRQGIFCELGQGCVDFPAVTAWLRKANYQGFITVEQDVLPGMGTPKASAARNRAYLRTIGL